MKLKYVAILLVGLLAFPAFSQIEVAFVGGPALTDLDPDGDNELNYSIGVDLDKHIGGDFSLCLRPAYSRMGATQGGTTVDVNLEYLTLGTMVKYQVGVTPFYVMAGLQGGINIDARAKDSVQDIDIKHQTPELDAGPVGAIGSNFRLFGIRGFLEGCYYYGLGNITNIDGARFENRSVMALLGLRLF
jgi:hypothetical protein